MRNFLVYHENPKTIHLGSIRIHFHHFLRYSPDSQKEETQLELNVSTADSTWAFQLKELYLIKTFTFFQRDAHKWEMIACENLSLTMVSKQIGQLWD